jgi:large subunit GTPase 1
LRRLEHSGKKKAPVTRVGKGADTFMPAEIAATSANDAGADAEVLVDGQLSRALDTSFFSAGSGLSAQAFVQGQQFTRHKAYPHQNAVADDGTAVSGRRARLMAVLANNPDGGIGAKGKKHNKGNKRVKQRSGKGYD